MCLIKQVNIARKSSSKNLNWPSVAVVLMFRLGWGFNLTTATFLPLSMTLYERYEDVWFFPLCEEVV